MNIKNTLTLLIFFIFLLSCKSRRTDAYKSKKIDNFFTKWERKSNLISDAKITGLEYDIKKLSEAVLCEDKSDYYNRARKEFPNLRYRILQGSIDISVFDYLGNFDSFEFFMLFAIKNYVIDNRAKCHNNKMTSLIVLNKKYKNKVFGKLKYGFGSFSEGKNKDNARAILENHHSSKNYGVSYGINEICINKSADTAVVKSSSVYSHYTDLYIKTNGKWEFKKNLSYIIE